MIIKYFRGGKSKSGAVEYLLNERVEQGTARVLRGNSEITKQLIKENTNKLKYRSGCLSFEESFMIERDKKEIMDLFEQSTFAGLDKDQYNILWVEHTDKNRIELNFVIPRLELTSMKAYNPHWHKADQKRLLILQEYINGQYKLSSPFKASKRELLKVDKLKKNTLTKQEIHSKVLEQIAKGHIQNREELIQYFKDSGATLPRIGKDYITVKFGDEKYRLKGVIYGEVFTTIERVGQTIESEERRYRRTRKEELQDTKQELDRLILYKSRENKQNYPKKQRNSDRGNQSEIRSNGNQAEKSNHNEVFNSLNSGHINRDRDILSQSERPMDSAKTNETLNTRGEKVYKSRKKSNTTKRERFLYSNNGVEHDRTRDDIIRGIREIEEKREQVFRRNRQTNDTNKESLRQLHLRISESNDRLSKTCSEVTERTRSYCKEYLNRNQADFRLRYNFWRNWRELSRAVTGIKKTSFGLERGAKRLEKNLSQYFHQHVFITQSLNTQQKIFLKAYDTLPSNSNLKGFFISKQPDHFKIISYKQKIHIKDYGDKITASNTSNQDLLVKMMIDIAESKGWDLNHLNIGGSDEFIKKARAEVSNRLEKKRELERANHYSRGYCR